MSAKKGICHICGKGTKLTKEHSPPQYSGNVLPAIKLPITKILKDNRIDFRNQKPDAEGLYYPTLCESCNGFTGRAYVQSFSKFCLDGLKVLHSRTVNSMILPVVEIYPLQIIKQAFTIFCAISSEEWIMTVSGLKNFILNEYLKELDYDFKLYIYFLQGTIGRSVGGSLVGDQLNQAHYVAEFSFPSFGFVLTENNYNPDRRLIDITKFKDFGYSNRFEFALDLPLLPNNKCEPLSYNNDDPKYNFKVIGANVDMHEQIQRKNK